ncbi:hypothetical protein BC830DRAFT_330517 [Chytriomyces sp. MP71]|nr:hypothetical protein BC830DRAFT_330517 [Chytriomyces sp. MP71]
MAVKKAKVIAAGSAISDPASTNSDGISFVLTPDNIAEKLEEGAWFIKFYSPMCGHCKMFAPTWIEIATKLKGIIKVGEVDCLQHMSVCTQYDIQLFPTVKYIGGGREEMFKGSRTLDNLIKFATGFMNVAFNAVSKDQVNSILHSESSVSFFYLYDYNRTSLKLVENFAKVASSVSNTIQVNVCPDPTALALFPTVKPSTHYPILLVSQGDKDSKDAHIFQASLELSTESSRLNAKNWILKHSKPLLQKLQESTSRAIMDGKNVVALGVIKSSDNDTASVATKLAVVDVLRSAARKWQNGGDGDSHDDEVSLVSGDRDNKPSVVFAWIDAKEKADYLRRAFAIDVATAEFPQFLIVDTKADLFYDTDEDSVNKLSFKSADAVLENLDAIFNGKLKGKIANGSTGIFKGLYRASKPFAAFMKLHPIFSFTILIGIIVGLIRCALVDSVDYRPLGRVEPKAD